LRPIHKILFGDQRDAQSKRVGCDQFVQRVAVAVFVGCADWAIGHGGLCIKRGDQDVVQQARLLFDSSRPNHAVDPEVKMLF
jgi:hypothetical protein